MKNWNSYIRDALSKEAIRAQFSLKSPLTKMFLFSFFGAVALGFFWQFINVYIIGSRASVDGLTVTLSTAKDSYTPQEQISTDILFNGPSGKKIAQLGMTVDATGAEGGTVITTPESVTATAVGGTTQYFEDIILKEVATSSGKVQFKLVLSSRKPVAELSDKVLVSIKYSAGNIGKVTFSIDPATTEVVTPGSSTTQSDSFVISQSSKLSKQISIAFPPTATPTTLPTTEPTKAVTTAPTTPPTAIPTKGPVACGDKTCAAGQICEANVCKVNTGGACKTADDCRSNNQCNNGKCMPTYCDGSNACPSGYSCKQGACFPATCNATNTCPNGYDCKEGACIPPSCKSDIPCAPGYSCDNGTCKKGGGYGSCTENASCNANGQCVSGTCFCKEGTFNCDRDWANGCESTAACAGSGDASMIIRLKFAGIGANLPPTEESMRVKVIVANKYLQQPKEQTVVFNMIAQQDGGIRIFEGRPTFSGIPLGDGYTVFIKGPKHIQKKICETEPRETADGRYRCSSGTITLREGANLLNFSNIYQLGGDLPVSNNQSGFVDSVDIIYIRANLGSKDPEVRRIGDLNLDGIVDTQDYRLAIFSLSFKYDEDISETQ